MRNLLIIILIVLSTNFLLVDSKSTTGDRVLVLLDKEGDKKLYTKFFKVLEELEYKLSYKLPTDPALDLFTYGERAYDHVINFAPKTKNYRDKVNPVSLINFVNNGGNILLAADSEISETVSSFAREFDIEFDDKETVVIDHFNYDILDDGKHTLLIANGITGNQGILSKEVIEGPPVLFRGIGHKAGTIPLLTRILWARDTSYSYDIKEDSVDQEPFIIGSKIGLISSLQARNSARVTFVGSLDFFSDRFFDSPIQNPVSSEKFSKSGNKGLARDLIKWTFQEKGVLRVTSRRHHKEGETEQLETYRIKDEITYTIDISEYDNGHWKPFNGTDVQLEAIMLDPYIRKDLTPLPISAGHHARKFETHIRLPDVYGVFTFKVNYKRPGYTYIEDTSVVAIRPFRHNEYPRFISAAYPYYTGAASMIAGFVVFSIIWFFNQDTSRTAENKKTN